MEAVKDIIVEVRSQGTLTLPSEWRKRYDIEIGDRFRLIDIGGMFVLVPATLTVSKLATEIEQAFLEAGLNMEDMFQSLREEREKYYNETYGQKS